MCQLIQELQLFQCGELTDQRISTAVISMAKKKEKLELSLTATQSGYENQQAVLGTNMFIGNSLSKSATQLVQ